MDITPINTEDEVYFGKLQFRVISLTTNRPIPNAEISIFNDSTPDSVIADIQTNSVGVTEPITLPAPPVSYSLTPQANRPYSVYNAVISANGYERFEINGIQILADRTAVQDVPMLPMEEGEQTEEFFVISPHTLYEDYPPKIEEDEIKRIPESGEVVLSRVVIPEYIIVHDGPPSDSSAKNYYVKYKDYIKNVASSEIYATWSDAAIQANILAIQSITLNRVYTEWYRNKGYDFTITSSTAYDQKWIPERNIYENISTIVDSIFSSFIQRPNIRQPLFTQYCDGKRVSCPNWMRQWESETLAQRGYSAIEILRYFYGNDVFITSAEEISGVPASWPGSDLTLGSRGNKVLQMQEQLNVIAGAYPLIPKIAADGIYGPRTAESVKVFQQVFGLPQTGSVDFRTWYKISEIYVGVSRIAELN